jgi:hypothetical protein
MLTKCVPDAPPRSPAEHLATIIRWLSLAIDGHSTWGRLARPLALLILDRLRSINQRIARLAARVAGGTYRPRRPAATPRPPTTRRPRQPNKLPQGFAWLVKLVPEAAAYGSQLQFLFADPEMAALMEAAPAALRRPLRSLCRMLGVAPPPILAAPPSLRPSTRPPKPERPSAQKKRLKHLANPFRVRYVLGLRDPPPLKNPS